MAGFLQRRVNPKRLNVVVVSKSFSLVGELADHAKSLLARFPASEPHVFLYSESPFGAGVFHRRSDVKAAVNALSELLASCHPSSAVAFSANERIPKGASNTGYFVHAKGYHVYPKRHLASGDEDNLELLRRPSGRLARHWGDRSARFTARNAARPSVFPEHDFSSGHTVQFRVCRDAVDKGKALPYRVVLVSADGLPPDHFVEVAKSVPLMIVNDSSYAFRPKAYYALGGRNFARDIELGNNGQLNHELAGLGVRVIRV